jgi:hypothetical protein
MFFVVTYSTLGLAIAFEFTLGLLLAFEITSALVFFSLKNRSDEHD